MTHETDFWAIPASLCGWVYLKRNWGGEVQNVSVMVAVDINEDGYWEMVGVTEGAREDKVADFIDSSAAETLSYMNFPSEY